MITQILLKEYILHNTISFYLFFSKRVFRIFPAFYFFLLMILLFQVFSGVKVDAYMFLSCFFYVGFYYPGYIIEVLAHSWSLAVEEQFYFLWPFAFKLVPSAKYLKKIPIILIVVSPFLRILTYYFLPIYKHKYPFLLHTRVDTLMIGCLFAIEKDTSFWLKVRFFALKKSTYYLSLFYLLVVYPYLNYLFLGKFRATIGYTLEGGFLLMVIIYLINAKGTVSYKLLNSKLLIHLGSISYGLYLWQQPFTYLKYDSFFFKFPLNLAAVYIFSLISYFFVEFPAMNYRNKVLGKSNPL